MFEWIAGAAIVYLFVANSLAENRIKKLEQTVRAGEIETNTLWMNVNKLYFLRDIEVQTRDTSLTPESIDDIKQPLLKNEWVRLPGQGRA